jgi:Domain of unknown function (DUF397)
METARVPARAIDVQALCQLHGAGEEHATVLTALARESRTEGWWQRYDEVLPVEVAHLDTAVAVRDSKAPGNGTLVFDRSEWATFLNAAKSGEFDR